MRLVTRRDFLQSTALASGALLSASAPATVARPNVLWILTDEQRTDSLGCYGSLWAQTPAMDALARKGVMFRHAITPAPVCAPARAALMTGRYPHETGVWDNIKPEDYPALPHLTETFHQAGYRSAGIGKRHYSGSNPGFQHESHFEVAKEVDWFNYALEFDAQAHDMVRYPAEPHAWILGGRFPGPPENKMEARVVRESLAWLDALPAATPFLLCVSFNAPHTPVVPPAPFDTLISDEAIRYPADTEGVPENEPEWLRRGVRTSSDAGRLSAGEVRKARRYYYGEAAYLDTQIAALLEGMGQRGLLENTIIAFVSDHGVHLGDYGLVQKRTFYPAVLEVPFFISFPGRVREGVQVETPVETRALLPTLLDLCGLEVPEALHGISLAHTLLTGAEPSERPVFSAFSLGNFGGDPRQRLVWVRDGDWAMAAAVGTSVEEGSLYHLAEDPHQLKNLFNEEAHRERRSQLAQLILEHLGR